MRIGRWGAPPAVLFHTKSTHPPVCRPPWPGVLGAARSAGNLHRVVRVRHPSAGGYGHGERVVSVQLTFPHFCHPRPPWDPSQSPPFPSPSVYLLPLTSLPSLPATLPSDPGPVPLLPHHPRDPRRVHLPVPHCHAAGEGEGGEGGNDKGVNKGLPTRHSFITSHMSTYMPPPPPGLHVCMHVLCPL